MYEVINKEFIGIAMPSDSDSDMITASQVEAGWEEDEDADSSLQMA